MNWIETISKEDFQSAVKEAMRPDMEKIENGLSRLAARASKLEGAMEESMRVCEANLLAMFSEFKVEISRRLMEKPENSEHG